jgi:hypothetical protein
MSTQPLMEHIQDLDPYLVTVVGAAAVLSLVLILSLVKVSQE